MFIDEFKICCVEDSKITEDMLDAIIIIKQHYWHYSYEQHKKWIHDNIDESEYHLIILNSNNEAVAYLNIVKTNVKYNGITEKVMGVGNVCVDIKYSGQGIGQLLMSICNYYLDSFNSRAILLCQEKLLKFYEKSGWLKYDGEVYLNGSLLEGELMLKKPLISSKIYLERNF